MNYYGILNELNYNGIMRKQASIGRLFPTFPERVRAVAQVGGATLVEQLPETWHFKVPSSSGNGVNYDVYIRFANLEEMIKKHVQNRKLWNKAKDNVDYRLLAAEVLNDVDIQTDCACPADTFWGAEYIKTQRLAQYGEQENRPPDIRNPKQYGALCKHGELVFEVLPAYTTTFASFLKRYWIEEVTDAMEMLGKELVGVAQATAELGRREEERPVQYARGGEEVPVGNVPEEGEEVIQAEPMGEEELGGEEKPSDQTGKITTKPGTKPTDQANKKATKPGTNKGTK